MKKRDRSDSSHAVLDANSRRIKAKKIISILGDEVDLSDKELLDIGTGSGYMAQVFGKATKKTTSIDVVDERRVKSGYRFVKAESEILPFADNSFDVVVSNHVIEHVHRQQIHIDEVIRVLKKGGLIYLATPNKWWLTDPHYRLPFISWLPRKMANTYLQFLQGKQWDVLPVSKGDVRKLHRGRLNTDSVTVRMMKNPKKYHLDTFAPVHVIFRVMPLLAVKFLDRFIPTIILIARKAK